VLLHQFNKNIGSNGSAFLCSYYCVGLGSFCTRSNDLLWQRYFHPQFLQNREFKNGLAKTYPRSWFSLLLEERKHCRDQGITSGGQHVKRSTFTTKFTSRSHTLRSAYVVLYSSPFCSVFVVSKLNNMGPLRFTSCFSSLIYTPFVVPICWSRACSLCAWGNSSFQIHARTIIVIVISFKFIKTSSS
jgi:hypothetical protein